MTQQQKLYENDLMKNLLKEMTIEKLGQLIKSHHFSILKIQDELYGLAVELGLSKNKFL